MNKKLTCWLLAGIFGASTFAGGMILSSNFKDHNYSIVLAEKQEDIDSIASSLAELKQEIESKNKRLQELQQQYDDLVKSEQEDQESSQQRINELLGQIAALRIQVQNSNQAYDELEAQYTKLEGDYQELVKQGNVDKQQIKDLDSQIAQLNEKIRRLESTQLEIPGEFRQKLLAAIARPDYYDVVTYGDTTLVGYFEGYKYKRTNECVLAYNSKTNNLVKVCDYDFNTVCEYGDSIYLNANETLSREGSTVTKTGHAYRINKATLNVTELSGSIGNATFNYAVPGTDRNGDECLLIETFQNVFALNLETNNVEKVDFTFPGDAGEKFAGKQLTSVRRLLDIKWGLFYANMYEGGTVYWKFENGQAVKAFESRLTANNSSTKETGTVYEKRASSGETIFTNLNNYKQYTGQSDQSPVYSSDQIAIFNGEKVTLVDIETMAEIGTYDIAHSNARIWDYDDKEIGILLFEKKENSIYVFEMVSSDSAKLVHTFTNTTITSVSSTRGSCSINVNESGEQRTYIFDVETSTMTLKQ